MTTDMFEWEEQEERFQIEIIAGVYVWDATDDGLPIITCGFLEDEKQHLSLPSMSLTFEEHAAHTAIALFREYVAVDPRAIDIVPCGFFDTLLPRLFDESEMRNRKISLYYKTKIHPGTPVHPDLRFMTHEELEIARPRITRGHYEAYRTGIGS